MRKHPPSTRRKQEAEARKAAFAEALAEGATVAQAASAAQVSLRHGKQYLADIRAELGPQAV